MTYVSLLECRAYENGLLKDVLEGSLANIGFDVDRFKGARVIVKPNLLTPAKPEKAIITDAEFFRAVVQIVRENGGKPLLVESPAVHSLKRVIAKTAYAEVVEQEGVEIGDPGQARTLHFEGAKRFKHLEISSAYFDADIILNLPKFKTHGITYITGAVKLLFGAIPGLEKSKMHLRLPDHADFAEYLLDLYGAMTYGFDSPKPIVHLMDAILAMEGEGPGMAGRPKWMNAVLAGENGIAVDCVATAVAGLEMSKAKTVVKGFERNYGISSADDISVVGDQVADLRVPDFVPATGNSIFSAAVRWPFNTRTFRDLFVEKPVPDEELCTLCYQCRKICPAEAISAAKNKSGVPSYDYGKCIRCYCCLEICPEAAIGKQRGRLQWVTSMLEA